MKKGMVLFVEFIEKPTCQNQEILMADVVIYNSRIIKNRFGPCGTIEEIKDKKVSKQSFLRLTQKEVLEDVL